VKSVASEKGNAMAHVQYVGLVGKDREAQRVYSRTRDLEKAGIRGTHALEILSHDFRMWKNTHVISDSSSAFRYIAL
jgi:hypothetical protein